MPTNNHIEFKANDLVAIKEFYSSVFGWESTDYGENYTSFSSTNSGINGGFEQTDERIVNGSLIVLANDNLEETQQKVEAARGVIRVPVFSFPGGKRFQLLDPSGNELAVWMEVNEE